MPGVRVVILARFPVPGQCKTRLIPALGEEGAAKMHRLLAERTVATVRESCLSFELWGTGGTAAAFVQWLGPLTYKEQPEGDLGQKLLAAAEPCPVLFLGTDCPDLTPEHLREAAAALEDGKAVIGPAHDGGYWTVGLAEPLDAIFRDMAWGTDTVYRTTRERMSDAGVEPVVLRTLHDLDRPEDLERWPDFRP